MTAAPRLTELAHGGGCGCKIAPAALAAILARMPALARPVELLVGTETGDDAAVWRLSDNQALVATTDFFTPIVDEPRDFGRIAATNALSDIYAMSAKPILALAIVGMPLGRVASEAIAAILTGGAEVCASVAVPVAGGHSIDTVEPIYGLAALGLVDPARMLTNKGGQAGDVLVLAKPLGVGVLSAALKRRALGPDGYASLLGATTQLNAVGEEMGAFAGVHAMTDVTGFGLAGHALEMARGAGLAAEIRLDAIPLLDGVEALVRAGLRTGASERNWASYGEAIDPPPNLPPWRRDLLTDPQTSGGLLIAVAAERAAALLDRLAGAGFASAAEIGRLTDGAPRLRLV